MCKKISIKLISFIIILLLGIVYIDALNDDFEKKYNILEGEKEIKAVVITEPENMEYKYRYTIRVESIKLNGNEIDIGNIKLYLDVKIKDTKYMPKFGDKILIKGEIKIPDSSRNYKGFDYREYLKTKKIFGTIESSSISILEKECLNFIEKFVMRMLNAEMMDKEYKEYNLSRQQRRLFEAWSNMYPVDEWECTRAKRIESIQGNENIFVKNMCIEKGLW